MTTLLNLDALAALDYAGLRHRKPFPWVTFNGLINAESHAQLSREFPARKHFERQEGGRRRHGQRPHDRYYLELTDDASIDDTAREPGFISELDIAPSWQIFMRTLREGPYMREACRVLDLREARLVFAWHIAVAGDEVSPHRDLRRKLATHLFYFNEIPPWTSGCGGETLLLGEKKTLTMRPEFEDFDHHTAISVLGNRSVLFRNSSRAWHGVRPLRLAPGAERRLFSIVFEATASLVPHLLDRVEKIAARPYELLFAPRTQTRE